METTAPHRTAAHLHRRALWLSYFTVAYNVLEGIASIIAGALAGSVALVGFGLDSFVESLSGSVMIWRFRAAADLTPREIEQRERRALKLIGYAFFVLAAYVVYESAGKLVLGEAPAPSVVGIVITSLSLVVMPVLFFAKHRTGRDVESRSLMADAKQTLACVFLSAAVLLGLVLNATVGLWQIDPVVGLLIAGFLVKEGREAVVEGKACAC